MIIGVTGKTVEHGLYLRFGSMRPNRVGQEEIKSFTKHGSFEVWVGVEPGRLTFQDFRFQDEFDKLLRALALNDQLAAIIEDYIGFFSLGGESGVTVLSPLSETEVFG